MALLEDDATFKEGDHPRGGNPENPGQFASSAGGGGSEKPSEGGEQPERKIKGTGAGAKTQPDFRGSMAHETSGDTTQPVQSLDELYERARAAETPFKDTVEETAKKFGGTVSYTPEQYAEPGTILKSKSSAERKVSSELGNDPKQLRDVLRATVSNTTVESTRKAAANFIAEHGENILRVKDRYADPIKGGYRDILINYRTPEGLVAEVQFNSKNMIQAKNEDAHKIYETLRSLPAADATPAMVERLEQQMAEIYDKAYLADGNGSWRKEKMPQIAADAAGQEVFRRYKLTPPDGEPFEAALVPEGDTGTLVVKSNRDGEWKADEQLKMADLIMPEQELSEWTVEKLEPGVLPAEPAPKHRALDRSIDIEYFTSESIGPNRVRTPEGFMICYDVPAARVGEMVYAPGEVPPELGSGRDGRVRVARSAAEVFNPKSMASLNGKPLTDDHPPVDVDPKNWKFYTKGVVVNPHRGEGEFRDFLLVDLIVYDDELIDDIEQGKREVSCGYNPDYIQFFDDNDKPIAGRGEQINIRYNHLALVKAGRCGPACAIGDRKTLDAVIPSDEGFFSERRARRLERLLSRF